MNTKAEEHGASAAEHRWGATKRNPVISFRQRALFIAAVIAVPKCVACAAGYIALVLGFATTTPELCDATPSASFPPAGWGVVAAVAVGAWIFRTRGKRVSETGRAVR